MFTPSVRDGNVSTANGYVRSEAVVVIYLRKSADAKRIYATVAGTSTNTDGFKVEGATYPSQAMQSQLIRDTYERANLKFTDVHYVEAHGTGTGVRPLSGWGGGAGDRPPLFPTVFIEPNPYFPHRLATNRS